MPQNSARQYFFYMILGSVLRRVCKQVSRSLTEQTRCEKRYTLIEETLSSGVAMWLLELGRRELIKSLSVKSRYQCF